MSKIPDKIMCCDAEALKARDGDTFSVECTVCGSVGKGPSPDAAYQNFVKAKAPAPPQSEDEPPLDVYENGSSPAPKKKQASRKAAVNKAAPEAHPPAVAGNDGRPQGPEQLAGFLATHAEEVRQIAAPFVANDRPALARLVKANVRYVLNQTTEAWRKVWSTPPGQESVVHAIEEAIALGAELGKMGHIVPFGSVCEFIPGVEAFEFALTNGTNPPFAWIQIEPIYSNDIKKVSRVNGEFRCELEPGFPRGDLVAIVVYGHNNRLGHTIGEVYDADRLLEKAKIHSTAYQYYLQDKTGFHIARSEGKTKTDAKGPFYEKQMSSRNGLWTKRVYLDDITNPYEGPDQPEMLRKAAGKSFLARFARVRNAEAAIDEVKEKDPSAAADEAIDLAFNAFRG